ncbi:esterase-like activity of phytase family protein [uncultured Castellaniella sp.]|uniref:esterase-like activity of phytase family protein n=1 Tax=uncultured Castellaniella sp. TaxID=647907 RepID=UPI002612DD44|nr:esterase-like activity of phytase family protein [uncultured Castellaniella sp.]
MHFPLPLTAAIATAVTVCAVLAPTCGAGAQESAGAQAPAKAGAARSASEPARFDLASTAKVGEIHITELSGLAWDADEKLLYAISDAGYVFQFRPKLDGDAIVAIEPVRAAALTDSPSGGGKPGKGFNAEGLAVENAANGKSGDSELIISLEGKPPRVMRFSPAGEALGSLPVPSPADDASHYRKKGRGLESVAIHPTYGLITAPESPLLGQPEDKHTLYSDGRQWSFARHSPDSRLKGIEVLPDGKLVVLERNKGGSKKSRVASLRLLDLATCAQGGACDADLLTELPAGPDNFEGMTLIDPKHVLLVSDNSGQVTQDTVFVLITRP